MTRARRIDGRTRDRDVSPPRPTSSDERLNEIARILALGILRLRARQQKTAPSTADQERDFGVDFSPDQSVHADG